MNTSATTSHRRTKHRIGRLILALLLVTSAVAAAVVFGQRYLQQDDLTFTVLFEEPYELERGTEVVYREQPVGRVTAVDLGPNPLGTSAGLHHVQVRVDAEYADLMFHSMTFDVRKDGPFWSDKPHKLQLADRRGAQYASWQRVQPGDLVWGRSPNTLAGDLGERIRTDPQLSALWERLEQGLDDVGERIDTDAVHDLMEAVGEAIEYNVEYTEYALAKMKALVQ